MPDKTHPLLAGLNAPQRAAVRHTDGPLLVLAGPGSGKTRVVTHRIAWLLEQGIWPSRIAALTFTNKAAEEMKKRLAVLAPDKSIWIGTFHKFCAYLLRQHAAMVGLSQNFTIYDTDESKKLLDLLLDKVDLPTGINAQKIATGISWAKNELILPEEYVAKNGSFLGQFIEKAYPEYQKALRQANAVDFDDLLLHIAILLRENPEVRKQLDARFRYILVDEYQDTNLAQYAIARALSIDHPNLCVTGDPDQSIYGWRGANIKNILDFEKDFDSVEIIRLEQNYRSTKRILAAASRLISFNEFRKEKDLFTENGEGAPVRVVCFADQREEADGIAGEIAEEIRAGKRRPQDYAIFYRMNALSRNLEHSLRREGVPFQLVRGLEFFNRKEIKDMIAYLQLIYNPSDMVSFVRIVNEPRRGIGKTTLVMIVAAANEHGVSAIEAAKALVLAPKTTGMSGKVKKALGDFVKMIEHLSEAAGRDEYTIEALFGMILAETKYKEQYEIDDTEEDAQRLENIEELISEAREFDKRPLEEGESALEKFLEQAALVSDVDAWDEETDRVSLMSLHAAKGLEFPVVYLIALEENILPHERSLHDQMQLEEERRLLFVGITRAEEELRISRTRFREFRGNYTSSIFSRFLLELPGEELTVKDGERAAASGFERDETGTDFEPDPEPESDFVDSEIEYEDVHVEYDEDGNCVFSGDRSARKKKKKPQPSLSLTTAAELLKNRLKK